MVNLGRLNLDGEEAGGGKNCGEYGPDSAKSWIRGDGRSSVAFLRCMAMGSSNRWANGELLSKPSGVKVRTVSGESERGQGTLGAVVADADKRMRKLPRAHSPCFSLPSDTRLDGKKRKEENMATVSGDGFCCLE